MPYNRYGPEEREKVGRLSSTVGLVCGGGERMRCGVDEPRFLHLCILVMEEGSLMGRRVEEKSGELDFECVEE